MIKKIKIDVDMHSNWSNANPPIGIGFDLGGYLNPICILIHNWSKFKH